MVDDWFYALNCKHSEDLPVGLDGNDRVTFDLNSVSVAEIKCIVIESTTGESMSINQKNSFFESEIDIIWDLEFHLTAGYSSIVQKTI